MQSTYDLDSLVKVQIPSNAQLMQKTRLRSGSIAPPRVQTSGSQPLIQQSLLPPVDELYRDKKPQVPMHRVVNYTSSRDPVHRHGVQALELRALEKKGTAELQLSAVLMADPNCNPNPSTQTGRAGS